MRSQRDERRIMNVAQEYFDKAVGYGADEMNQVDLNRVWQESLAKAEQSYDDHVNQQVSEAKEKSRE